MNSSLPANPAMDPMFPEALQYIHEVQAKLTGDGRRHIYDQFIQTLKQFRCRMIDSSTATSTIQKLFQNQPDLLQAFQPFMPSHCSSAVAAAAAAPPADGVFDVSVCVDLVNRAWTRFRGGGVYWKFSDCMHAYSRGEIAAAAASDEVVGLFEDNSDLVAEFSRFVNGTKKRHNFIDRVIDSDDDIDHERGKRRRRRGSNSGSRDDDQEMISAAARKSGKGCGDYDMEASLCDVDVRIGNLEAVREKTFRQLAHRRLSPADVPVDERFTPLNLAFIRRMDKKILERIDRNQVDGLRRLVEILERKKVSMEKERLQIVRKWDKIRKS